MLNPLYMKHRPSSPISIGPPSSPPSLHNIKDIEELSAERLNLYLDRHDAEELEQIEEDAGDDAGKKKSRWRRNLRIALPHVGLVILSAAYTLLGAAIFHHYEKPFEEHLRNETAHRVYLLKQKIIDELWHMNSNGTSYPAWVERAQSGMDDIIRDVFIDYTKNYMTPEDVITGSGPYKWSFGSSIFFSWTAITTIGYGHIVPRTNAGRIAIIFYALFGIPLILVTIADMGRFLSDVSEIHTQNSDGLQSEDTRAQADDLEPEQPHHERRVSVVFILFIMLGYVAGGAYLIRYWESWSFFDAFYFCFVTVTTIGFGDIVPLNVDFFPATLAYIVLGLIITTMCIDLVGSEYIRDIHFYGRSLGRSFMTIGGKEYLLDCLINGRQPDLNWIGGRPFVPPDIYYFKWIEHPRTLSFTSDRVLASMESLDLNTSRCSTARTLTPREYYQKILFQYCKQLQPDEPIMDIDQ
uniref:Ion_trans_2 domain-containing protein n=1 Tax=Heterorhabditis bacteriophora TaxID=37862 RepID=A0A1I7XM54_HETBA